MTFLGVDCGTSALKAVLVDDEERVIAVSRQSYAPNHPRPLWSEQNPDDWRDAMYAAMAALAQAVPAAMRAVEAIGLSGQMHSAVLLDDADRPARPAILHNDARAFAEAAELAEKYPGLAEIVGVKPMAGFTAPKLLWLRRRESETFKRIRCILPPKDYLRLCLTGEKCTDMSDAAGTWWLDEAHRQWSPQALEASGVERANLPRLAEGSEVAGFLRDEIADRFGLARRIVVAAGGGDAAAGAIGIGAIAPGASFVSLGTSAQLIVAADTYSAAPARLVHSFAHALPRRWYRMAAMLNGAGALAFAARLFGSSPAELEREAAIDYRGPGEALFLPYLSGERTPHDNPNARGVFFGLTSATRRCDIARAVMEGVAYTMADARECVEDGARSIGEVGLIGGGAKSALWTKMIAAALERPVVRYEDGDTGPAFGAARLARLARTGEAPETLCRPAPIADRTEPDPLLVAAFRPRIERFRSLYRAVAPEFAAAASNLSDGAAP